MSRLNEIIDYFIAKGEREEDMVKLTEFSVYLSLFIAHYAHRNQVREDGSPYVTHPLSLLNRYRDFVGITDDDPFCIDSDLMSECNIPYEGVQEVCLLHDVLEDTDFTMEELEDIFREKGLDRHFNVNIKKPLELITQDKSEEYDKYIGICLMNPTSALVKMLDLQDNLNVFTLNKLSEKEYERGKNYYRYLFTINSVYHFIENCREYHEKFNCAKTSEGENI